MDEAQLDRAVDHSNDNNSMTYLDVDRRTIRHDGNTDFRIHRSVVKTIPSSHSYISTFRRTSLPRSSSSTLTRTLVRSSIRRSSNCIAWELSERCFTLNKKLTNDVFEPFTRAFAALHWIFQELTLHTTNKVSSWKIRRNACLNVSVNAPYVTFTTMNYSPNLTRIFRLNWLI